MIRRLAQLPGMSRSILLAAVVVGCSSPTVAGRWVNAEMTLTLQESANGLITGVGTYAGDRAVRVTGIRAGRHVSLHVLEIGTDIPLSMDGTLAGHDVIEMEQGPWLSRIN